MEPEFIWIMFVLKIPLVALLLLVWYAIRATPDLAEDDDGGSGGASHPRAPRPAGPRRRGPHLERASAAGPPRVRRAGTTRLDRSHR